MSADGRVLEPCVAGCHLVRLTAQELADHFLGDVGVDQACRVGAAELVGGESEWPGLFIVQPDGRLPDYLNNDPAAPRTEVGAGVRPQYRNGPTRDATAPRSYWPV